MSAYRMKTRSDGLRVMLLLLLSGTILMASGCSIFSAINNAAKRMVRNVQSSSGDLKKKIGITLFENKTSFPDQAVEQRLFNVFVKSLKSSCSDEIWVTPTDTDYPSYLVTLPRNKSGWIDTLELAAASRKLGFNAIVTGAFTNIIKKQEKRGFWWFKETHQLVEVHAAVEVYDTLTGAKLMDQSFIHETEVEEFNDDGVNMSTDYLSSFTNEALMRMAPEMAEKVCSKIVGQPWDGYITSVQPDKIIIAAGQTTGIKQGDVFEVYDSSDIFNGSEGQQFYIPGQKIGEIKVTAVFTDHAEAVNISGQNITENCYIKAK